MIWQVFWLGLSFNTFPLLEQWYKLKAFQNPLLWRDLGGRPYSYGDSAGITPDFPFNLFRKNGMKNQIGCKCRKTGFFRKNSFQQKTLFEINLKADATGHIKCRCCIIISSAKRIDVITEAILDVKNIICRHK